MNDNSQKQQLTVKVQRSVHINRLLIMGVIVGAALAALFTALFPVVPEGHYTLGQIVGFMALIGGALGLLVAALLGLVLNRAAQRRTGSATAYLEQSASQPQSGEPAAE